MSKKAQELAARYGRKTNILEIVKEIIDEQESNKHYLDQMYHITAFPPKGIVPEQLIVTENSLEPMKWGLIPHWVKPKGSTEIDIQETLKRAASIRKMELNARSETIFEKPSYRFPILKQRCIIPSTGYFEYHHNPDGSITPYFIYLTSEEIFSIGGIYELWKNPLSGELVKTYSLITTEANLLTGEIHNGGKNPHRMPLILHHQDEEKWLSSNLKKTDIQDLLKVYKKNNMAAYPVSKDYEKRNPHDNSIINKVA